MASPVILYIAPDTGIEVTVDKESIASTRSSHMLPGDIIRGYSYQLSNMSQFHLKENKNIGAEFSRGFMSPMAHITLPPYGRKKSGILNPKATKFAFLHPPDGLAGQIDWSSYDFQMDDFDDDPNIFPSNTDDGDDNNDNDDDSDLAVIKSGGIIGLGQSNYEWAIPYLSVTGAFIYFDDDLNVVSVNVVTLQRTGYALNLSGPFRTPQPVIRSILETRRARVLPLDAFHECSFVAMSWVRPKETFGSNLPSGIFHDNRHGTFLFMRYDGSAVSYAVNSSFQIDYTGESEIIPDILSSQACQAINFDDMTFATAFVDDTMAKKWRKYITDKCEMAVNGKRRMSSQMPTELEMEKSLIHEACRSCVNLDSIKILLKDKNEQEALRHQDQFGWNPLHYACAFSPTDAELLKYLLDEKPDALHQKDSFGRYPIHVLCDSGNVTCETIQLLLAGTGKLRLLEPTKYLGRLPLHIALSRGAPVDVIRALIDADEAGESIRFETHDGMRPIHAALSSKATADVIHMLVDADSHISDSELDEEADIFAYYRGLLPIHMACLNGSSNRTVSLLLDKDINGITLLRIADRTMAYDVHSGGRNVRKMVLTPGKFLSKSSLVESLPRGWIQNKIALHLAISYSSDEVIRLFLNRAEIEGESNQSVLHRDQKGRCALHLACIKNSSPYIIKMLLKIDSEKKTVTFIDKYGLTPILYACEHNDAKRKSIEYLLEAEKIHWTLYGKLSLEDNKALGSSCKSPFWYACKAQAPCEVLDLLMSQPHFNLRDFDRLSMRNDLADFVKKNPILQTRINKRMASRLNFFKLSLNIITNFVVLFAFYWATEDCANGCMRQFLSNTLWSCIGLFALNEFFQMINQTLRGYFLDVRNWYELTMISLLSFSIWFMEEHKDNCALRNIPCELIQPHRRDVLMITGIFLVLNVIFSLRSIFLPFALFATGIVNIMKTLIPFFSVSMLVLAAFAQAYRLDVNFQAPPADGWGDTMHSQCLSSFGDCFLAVLQGFFGGPDGTFGRTDIIFGIIVVIVLLNVVIAIVSDSWEDSQAVASTAFWRSRVHWLAESAWMQVMEPDEVEIDIPIFKWIDGMKWIPFNDSVSWNKDEPYKLVSTKQEYEDPAYYFDKDYAKLIMDAHSLESSLFWLKKDGENKMGVVALYGQLGIASLQWSLNNLLYLILIIIGIPTLGLLWPMKFRLLIVSLGVEYRRKQEENNSDTKEKSP